MLGNQWKYLAAPPEVTGLEVGENFGFCSTNQSSHKKISMPALPSFNAGMLF
jgi:hypothetical protein